MKMMTRLFDSRKEETEGLRAAKTARRPRLLMVAYYFPPANKVGGIRAFNIAKALARRGWDVTVLSPGISNWRNVERSEDVARELESEGIRCMRTGHGLRNLSPHDLACRKGRIAWIWGGVCRRTARFLGVEYQIGWFKRAARACAVFDAEDIDLVLATGPPFIGFRLAAEIAERLGRPYVLDYRDLWTRNPHAQRAARGVASSAEGRLIEGAAAVTVVSTQLAESLRCSFGVRRKVYVITNGYDPEDLAGVEPRDFGHFAIIYTGQFIPPKRVIDPLLAVLTRLKAMNIEKPWRFHYFGPHGEHVRTAMANHDLDKEVIVHGNVTRREALAATAGAGVSIVITSVSETASREDLGIVTGKVFESIGLRKLVLAIAPRGSDLEPILTSSGTGLRFSGSEIEPMAKFLAEAIKGTASIDAQRPEQYSWPEIGETVHELLSSVIAKKGEHSVENSRRVAWALPDVG
jgi:glycosyltransferase involved in cell wall biosynthesis